MKIRLLIITLLVSIKLTAQLDPPSQDMLQLPDMVPPSPEAYHLTKYGDKPINEFTGMATANIPLYIYKAGKLEIPIELNYVGAGVKVDEMSTWVGINWMLSAGGVITRTIVGRRDESTSPANRIYLSEAEINSHMGDLSDGSADAEFFNTMGRSDEMDSEVDLFAFSFAGHSGSFFLDGALQPVQRKVEQNLRIEITDNDLYNRNEITITTTDGVKYFFGGDGFIETTNLMTISGGGVQSVRGQGVTSYYLKKIEHPVSGVIEFLYSIANNNLNNTISDEQSLTFSLPMGPLFYEQSSPITNTKIVSKVSQQMVLTQIRSPNNQRTVNFDSENIDFNHPSRKLTQITVVKDTLERRIALNYIQQVFPYGYSRLFLTDVSINQGFPDSYNTSAGRRSEHYKLEYDSPESLPTRFTKQQDYIGYYNGRNNQTLLPNNPFFNPEGSPFFANRRPDFNYAKTGALTHIYYPTGGYTKFEYESLPVKEEVCETINLRAWRNSAIGEIPSSFLGATWPELDLVNGMVFTPIPYTQNVEFTVRLEAQTPPMVSPLDERAVFRITNMTTDSIREIPVAIPYIIDPLDIANPEVKTWKYNHQFNEGHTYYVELLLYAGTPGTSNHNYLQGYVNFSICSHFQKVDGYGIRVKRKMDYSSNDQVSNIRRYYYNPINNIIVNVEDLPLIHDPWTVKSSVSTETQMTSSTGGNYIRENHTFHETLTSSSFDNYFSNTGTGNYPVVTISYGGDSFEQGGVQKSFLINSEADKLIKIETPPPVGYPSFAGNCSQPNINEIAVLNGTLENEQFYATRNGGLHKVREISYGYEFPILHAAHNILSVELYKKSVFLNPQGPPISPNNILSNFFLGVYKTNSYRLQLTQIESKDFVEPVPLGALDESIYKTLITTKELEYNSFAGQPTSTKVYSSTGSFSESKNYYVDQASNLAGAAISSQQLENYNLLQQQNIISNPIQIDTHNEGALTMRQRTIYKKWFGSDYRIFPETILASKGNNPLEERVIIHEYDPKGNPTLVSLKDGTKTRYYYNNLDQVMVKIENYTGGTGTPPTDEEMEPDDSDDDPNPSDPCAYHEQYPNSLVTLYFYNAYGKIKKIKDPKCNDIFFVYDSLHRLKYVRDNEGNIINEFDNNFRRY